MSLFVKLSGAALAFLIALFAYLLEFKWRDRRTKTNQHLRYLFFAAMCLALVSANAVVFVEHQEAQREDRALSGLRNRARDEATSEKQARSERAELQRQLTLVEESLQPFVALAKKLYPAASEEEGLLLLTRRVTELESQIDELKQERQKKAELARAEAIRRRTPPLFDAFLARSEEGNYFVVIDSKNLIPFSAQWRLVTKRGRRVSGTMSESVEIHPTAERRRFQHQESLNLYKIVDGYVELRFDYESAFSPELGYPPELSGKLVRRYQLIHGAVFPVQ